MALDLSAQDVQAAKVFCPVCAVTNRAYGGGLSPALGKQAYGTVSFVKKTGIKRERESDNVSGFFAIFQAGGGGGRCNDRLTPPSAIVEIREKKAPAGLA